MPPETAAVEPLTVFGPIIGLVAFVALVGFVILIVTRARNLARVIKSDPSRLMYDADPAPTAESAERSTESRLATLDTLLMQGRITPDEYKAARAKVLGEV